MKTLRSIATFAVVGLFLSACGNDPGAPVASSTSPAAQPAEVSSKDFGDYVLHFNAISTDQLQPQVARAYNIVRSGNRAMLNVSIIKKVEGTTGESVAGSVSATAANLTGQVKNLNLRQIQENDAIYYIGDVSVANGETLIFTIDATPINESSRFSVRMQRQFFSN